MMDGEQVIIDYEKFQLRNIVEIVAKMNKIFSAN
jgi:hypothetical protein